MPPPPPTLLLLSALFTLTLFPKPSPAAPANPLPVYFEDNHAGSFFFFAQSLKLDSPHTLVLFDAHSDASAAPFSDGIRSSLRRVRSPAERQSHLDSWRSQSRIQPFDWIEPLMPAPFGHVVWVYAESASPSDLAEKQTSAANLLDGRLEPEPRLTGKFSHRFSTADLTHLPSSLPEGIPTVASIDLDFFAGTPPDQLPARWSALFDAVLALPDLQAVSFAISRPWLESDDEAHRLLFLALRDALSLDNATFHFEPFAPLGHDRSERAKSLYLKGDSPPRYDITAAPDNLKDLLLAHAPRLQVTHDPERWDAFLDEIRLLRGEFRLAPDNTQISADGIFRTPSESPLPAIRAHANIATPIVSIRWFQLLPDRSSYNVLPQLPAGKTFAGTAPPLIRYREIPLAETVENALPPQTWSALLKGQHHLGSVRIAAEVTTASGTHRTPHIELRVTRGSGFLAGISEQFGLPYVFGAGFLRHGHSTGPEAGGGNDCANFLAYASRRAGRHIPWSNPAQLRSHLLPIASKLRPADRTPIPENAASHGLVVHFHSHVGTLWEDLPPLRSLGPEDLIAHHLSGPPEIIPLRDLLSSRPHPTYDALTFPQSEPALTITVAGDINFASRDPASPNPLAPYAKSLSAADLAIANLECAISTSPPPIPHPKSPFRFLAPPSTIPWLSASGIDLVSLANNHSADAPLTDTLAHLSHHKILSVGAGPHLEAALEPALFKIKNLTVAVFAVSLINPDASPASPTSSGIATLPNHRDPLLHALRRASSSADFILVLPHWGDEYTAEVSDSQRHWARWFIDHGAHAVVGSHSHHPQHVDTYRGRPIFYSLGNLSFPNKGPNKAFRTPALAHLTLDPKGHLTSFHQSTPP